MSTSASATDPVPVSVALDELLAAAAAYRYRRRGRRKHVDVIDAIDALCTAAHRYAAADLARGERSRDADRAAAAYVMSVVDLCLVARPHDLDGLTQIVNATCFTSRWSAADLRSFFQLLIRVAPKPDLAAGAEAAASVERSTLESAEDLERERAEKLEAYTRRIEQAMADHPQQVRSALGMEVARG